MDSNERVQNALRQIQERWNTVLQYESTVKKLLGLPSLREPYNHAAADQYHNRQEHSTNPNWSIAEGIMLACIAAYDSNQNLEFLTKVLENVWQSLTGSEMLYDILRPLSPDERKAVVEIINASIKLSSKEDATQYAPVVVGQDVPPSKDKLH